jgi:hypothetical protein
MLNICFANFITERSPLHFAVIKQQLLSHSWRTIRPGINHTSTQLCHPVITKKRQIRVKKNSCKQWLHGRKCLHKQNTANLVSIKCT